jgi:hypothetical protein
MILLQTQRRMREIPSPPDKAELALVSFPSRLPTSEALTELSRYSHKFRRAFPHLDVTFRVVGIQYLPEEIDEAVLWSVGLIPIEDMCGQVDSELAEWADLGRLGPNSWDNEMRARAGLPPLGDDQAAA